MFFKRKPKPEPVRPAYNFFTPADEHVEKLIRLRSNILNCEKKDDSVEKFEFWAAAYEAGLPPGELWHVHMFGQDNLHIHFISEIE